MANIHLENTVAPTDTLVSLPQLKSQLAIEHSADDTRLTLLLNTVGASIESETNLCLVAQTWVYKIPHFPCSNTIRLPKSPVSAVAITYYDADNSEQTFSSASYTLMTTTHQAHIVLNPDNEWATTYERPDAVSLTLTCGFSSVPNVAKQLCLMDCALLNEDRGDGAYKESPVRMRLVNLLRRGQIC